MPIGGDPGRGWMCRFAIIVLSAVVISIAVLRDPAIAAAQLAPTREEARAMFREAERLFAQGSYEAAAAHFEAAYRTLPHPSVLYNIAQCYERLHEPSRAIRTYRRYLASAGSAATDRDRVGRRIGALRALVAEIRISGGANTEVYVDGRLEGRAPGTVLVDPGRRDVRVGRQRAAVTVQPGEVRLLAVGVGPVRSTAPRVVGWVLAGLGAASFGAAWGFWANLQAKEDAFSVANPMLPGFIERQAAVDDAVPAILVSGALGATFATAGMPLLLPSAEGTPWWAWACGVAALVPAGIGAYQLAIEGACVDTEGCTRREQTAVLGALLLMHAAPLLSIPIVYLLRSTRADGDAARSHVAVRLVPSASGLLLTGALSW